MGGCPHGKPRLCLKVVAWEESGRGCLTLLSRSCPWGMQRPQAGRFSQCDPTQLHHPCPDIGQEEA